MANCNWVITGARNYEREDDYTIDIYIYSECRNCANVKVEDFIMTLEGTHQLDTKIWMRECAATS